MRICIIYDCLYPWSIGGAERWYRRLAEGLAARGHQVTFLTLTQWSMQEPPQLSGITTVAVGPRMTLYSRGRRRIFPPLRFGWGVFVHLLRFGNRYDVVHTASFPYFSLLAAGVTRFLHRFRINCDWHEVWSHDYWRSYLGKGAGHIGWLIQRLCAQVPQKAYTFSRLHASRLEGIGIRGSIGILTGEYVAGRTNPIRVLAADPPVVVYAGRMVPEKRVPLLVDAVAVARRTIPQLRAVIFGDGPERARVRERIDALALGDIVDTPGIVPEEQLADTMAGALCVVQPSSREGYGMVVVEASAAGVPAIVVAGDDNAAVELIELGRNGFVASIPDACSMSAAIVKCWRAGAGLRATTREWYAQNAARLSLQRSLDEVIDGYGQAG
jgi:glycosyltransferase involved in cell wall biosynthesis